MPKRTSGALRAATLRATREAQIAERQFTRDVVAIMRGVHDVMLRHVEKAGRARTDAKLGAATGDPSADVAAVVRAVIPQLKKKVEKAHSRMAVKVDKAWRDNLGKLLPVTYSALTPQVQQAARNARDASVKLVEDATRAYAQQVREVFELPNTTHGKRWEDLRDELLERADVSVSRAELIARDQTLKLNGAINQARQTSAGIDSYTWDTSGDERVRDEHAELDGKEFSWSDPPSVGHPGQDFQCRCIAIPILPELTD